MGSLGPIIMSRSLVDMNTATFPLVAWTRHRQLIYFIAVMITEGDLKGQLLV